MYTKNTKQLQWQERIRECENPVTQKVKLNLANNFVKWIPFVFHSRGCHVWQMVGWHCFFSVVLDCFDF